MITIVKNNLNDIFSNIFNRLESLELFVILKYLDKVNETYVILDAVLSMFAINLTAMSLIS